MRALTTGVLRDTPALLLVLALSPACRANEAPAAAPPAPSTPASAPAPARPKVVVLGDSLTAGLGLPADQAFPAHLQRKIDGAGLRYDVTNAGVSGDTSAGGIRRLDWVLTGDVRVLVVALGANDGLRGLPPQELKRNLTTIVATARRRGVIVLLAGMEAPPNFGPDYTAAFRSVYRDVADEQGVAFVPFLLTGVAGDGNLNQPDGIHPNEEGARRVAETVWRTLEPVLAGT